MLRKIITVVTSLTLLELVAGILLPADPARAADYFVYSVYKELDMGTPGEVPQKDYYINMGTSSGIHEGMYVRVLRRTSTYDLLNERLYKDVLFPIARLKILHAEANASIGRLDKMFPPATTPAFSPHAVMVGDLVEPSE